MRLRYLRMKDQKPVHRLARNQDFAIAGGLEPKVKMLTQYVLYWEGVVRKLV